MTKAPSIFRSNCLEHIFFYFDSADFVPCNLVSKFFGGQVQAWSVRHRPAQIEQGTEAEVLTGAEVVTEVVTGVEEEQGTGV